MVIWGGAAFVVVFVVAFVVVFVVAFVVGSKTTASTVVLLFDVYSLVVYTQTFVIIRSKIARARYAVHITIVKVQAPLWLPESTYFLSLHVFLSLHIS